ncbi:uncharacterized protein C6orf203 homolog [Lingula anatina]|uniref:Uncharacterized protein C6orf203 homolog n=1 Tax=Lingula anatina TaxID=7574 RepID=A0A1S3K4U3_LINAN|nr:uncharacterized protein C6orf203 homolog [Lingula anatina]|eukprot:XP_013417439.1 uncharacterized protein C6orf203 homolog [Lingula anatina]
MASVFHAVLKRQCLRNNPYNRPQWLLGATTVYTQKDKRMLCCASAKFHRKHQFQTPSFDKSNCKIFCYLNSLGNFYCYFNHVQSNRFIHTSRKLHLPKGKRKDTHRYQKDDAELPGEDDESDEELDSDDDDGEVELGDDVEEETDGPEDYRTMNITVKTVRVDSVVASGLAISNKQTEALFLGTKILVNGEKIRKKARRVKVGDILDVIGEGHESNKKRRVKVLSIDTENVTKKGRARVTIRAWRNPFE